MQRHWRHRHQTRTPPAGGKPGDGRFKPGDGRFKPGDGRFAGQRSSPLLVLALALSQLAAGCAYPNDELDPRPRPTLKVLNTFPPPEALDVPLDSPVIIYFDDALDATSTWRGSLRLLSGTQEFPGTIKVDLIDRSIALLPDRVLRPALRYGVQLSRGLVSLSGGVLGEELVFGFTTGQGLSDPASRSARAPSDGTIEGVWRLHCVRCHAPPHPAAGLDLASAHSARPSLLAWRGDRPPVVEPGDHARSYLLLKLLNIGGFSGFEMPPDAAPLSRQELRTVADWVDSLP